MLLPKRKQCTKCGRKLPATTEFFYKQKGGKYGLQAWCKECDNERRKCNKHNEKIKKEQENPFNDINTDKVWNHCEYCIKVCSKCGRILVANEMNFSKNKRGKYDLMAECKECNKEHGKQYYENNKEERKEYRKQYRINNPDKVFNDKQKRRQKEENQGRGFIENSWYEMMNFFDWKCAYSGKHIGGNINPNRTVDHIVPISKGGLNEPWNCVPMYMPYNSSKNTSDMLNWYQQQEYFSIERLEKIYEWCEYAYEKWGNEIND